MRNLKGVRIGLITALLLAVSLPVGVFADPSKEELSQVEKYKAYNLDVSKLKVSQESNGWKGYELKDKTFVWVDPDGRKQAYLADGAFISTYSDKNKKEVGREITLPSGRTFTIVPGQAMTWNVVGDEAPDFDLPIIMNGKGKQQLSDLQGKWVLLDFWASWCGPCMQALPGTEALYQKLKDKGLKIIGVNVDGDKPSALKAAKSLKLSFPIVYADDTDGQRDWDAVQLKDYGIHGIPCLVLINPEGVVEKFGFINEEEIEQLVSGEDS